MKRSNDFVSSGFGGVGWRVEAVEIIRSSIPGWKLVLQDGIELVCADGTVLAGIAGPVLPSDPGAIPALAFIRHPVNTREARRRFSVRLLDGEKHGSPAIRRLFGTRLRYGSREQRNEKVFYFYQQAASFLATCKNAAPTMRTFSAVDVTSCGWIERSDQYRDWRIAGKRPEREMLFPLFHLDEDSPPPVGVAVLHDFLWQGEWRPVISCTRLDKPSEWVVPVFAERDGRAWRDLDSEGKTSRSRNPLIIAAGQVPVFMADPFVNQRVYVSTASSRKKPLVRIKPEPPKLYHLDDVAKHVPPDPENPVTESTAAEELWALFARMAGSGVDCDALLAQLKKRYRDEVWKKCRGNNSQPVGS